MPFAETGWLQTARRVRKYERSPKALILEAFSKFAETSHSSFHCQPSLDTSHPKRPGAPILGSFVFLDTTGSRSWMRYRLPRRKPSHMSVRFLATCFIHSPFGSEVIPPMHTQRVAISMTNRR